MKCSKSPSPGAEILKLYRHGNPLAAVIIDTILVSPLLLLIAITTCCFNVEKNSRLIVKHFCCRTGWRWWGRELRECWWDSWILSTYSSRFVKLPESTFYLFMCGLIQLI
jgi:hypothetical protein